MMPPTVCLQAVALRINDNLTLRESSLGQSIQYAKLIAIKLAIEQFIKENQNKVYLFSDSWIVANLIAIESKTRKEQLKIRNKEGRVRTYNIK